MATMRLQNLEGAGVLGTGFNPVFGAAGVRVPPDRAASARALLSDQQEIAADPEALPPSESDPTEGDV